MVELHFSLRQGQPRWPPQESSRRGHLICLMLLCASCQLHWKNSTIYVFTSKDHFKIMGTKHFIPAATSTTVIRKGLRIIRTRCEDSSKWISNVGGNQRNALVLEALCNWPEQNFWYIGGRGGEKREEGKKEGRRRDREGERERERKEKVFLSCKLQKTLWKEGPANIESYFVHLLLRFGSDFPYIVKITVEIIIVKYTFKVNIQ